MGTIGTWVRAGSAVLGLLAYLTGATGSAAAQAVGDPPTTEVMIVGVTHLGNPGRDLHNLKVDDVLAPKRQAEIAAVTDALARFKPNVVGVEWSAERAAERWKQYRAGTLAPSRDESVQLGFRLAKTSGATRVYGLDADGDFPYERLQNFAESRGYKPLLDQQNALVEADVQREGALLAQGSVGSVLRYVNDPAHIMASQGFYRTTLRIGLKSDQPGADLLSAWYARNFRICANLLQAAKPGDRVVVFYGAGHALLLRQCVAETPGYRLVEPDAFLPG